MSKHKNRRKNKQLMRPIEKPEGYFYWEDLIERGWTDYECKRLRNYAPKKQPKLFIQEEVFAYEKIMKRERRRLEMEEKRKRKEEEKERKEWSINSRYTSDNRKHPDKYIKRQELLGIGFTKNKINKFFPKPTFWVRKIYDVGEFYDRYPNGVAYFIYYYSIRRVVNAIKTKQLFRKSDIKRFKHSAFEEDGYLSVTCTQRTYRIVKAMLSSILFCLGENKSIVGQYRRDRHDTTDNSDKRTYEIILKTNLPYCDYLEIAQKR